MNTKKKSSWLSLILALAMMITTSLTGLMPVSGVADTVQAAGNTRTIYFTTDRSTDSNNGIKWSTDNGTGTVAIEYGTGNVDDNTWMAMTRLNRYGNGYLYKAEVPSSATCFRINFLQDNSKAINYVPGMGNNEADRSDADTASVVIKIVDGKYETQNPNNSGKWDNNERNNLIPADEDVTNGKVTLLYGEYYYNGQKAAANGLWAKQVNKSDLGISTTSENRTVYFTTMNSENGWNYSDTMYIYQNGTWTPMENVKEDGLNVNNGNEQRGTIWKGTISAYEGAEFRFASFASDSNRSALTYGVSTNEKTWATNEQVSAKIIVKNDSYWVQRPDGSDVWASNNTTLSFTNTGAEHVFYNYGKYGISDKEYNHGVAMYSVGSAGFKSYVLLDVTGNIAGTTFYINDIGSLLTESITVTYKSEKNDVTKNGGTLTKNSDTGLYSITIPELTNEDNTANGEWKYVTVTDANDTAVLSDYDVTQVDSSKPVYTYAATRVSNSEGITNLSDWRAINTSEAKNVGKKLYVGSTGITTLSVDGGKTSITLTTSDDGNYFEIPDGITTKTLMIAGASSASSSTGVSANAANTTDTTYYFYWEDPSYDTLTIASSIAGVTEQHKESTGIRDLSGIQDSAGGSFKLNGPIETSNKYIIHGPVELDLNGYNIIASGPLFEIASGGSLTIIDSASRSIQNDFDNNVNKNTASDAREGSENTYNDRGSVSKTKTTTNGKNEYTVNYYVTESVPTNTTGTTDTRYLYSYTTSGAIITSTSSHLIQVENGGTFNLSGGLLTSSGTELDSMIVNYGTFNMTDGCVAGAKSKAGGAGVNSEGTFNMTGGVIANNDSYYSGAGVKVGNGTFTLDGGIISGNRVLTDKGNFLGGGIYLDSNYGSNVTVNINGGYVTNNIVYLNVKSMDGHDESWEGGGGVATKGGNFNMSGGYVTGNYSGNAGGGLLIGQFVSGSSKYYGTKYKISGGTIASNWANRCEGGGIRITGKGSSSGDNGDPSSGSISNADATVYITNNTKNDTYTWGGGGIFVQQGATLNIKAALITANTAKGYGGGFASCPTGDVASATNDGAAIYNNEANGNNVANQKNTQKHDDYTLKGRNSYFAPNAIPKLYKDFFAVSFTTDSTIVALTGSMLGDTSANWSGLSINQVNMNDYSNNNAWLFGGSSGNDTIPKYTTYSFKRYAAMTANPTDADVQTSIGLAGVFISGNLSDVHGGGIMSNGIVTLGTLSEKNEVYPGLTLNGTKKVLVDGSTVSNANNYLNYFKYTVTSSDVTNTDGELTSDSQTSKTFNSSSGSNGVLNFKASSIGTDGTTTFYLYEKTGDASIDNIGTVGYSKVVYKITLTLAQSDAIEITAKSSMKYNYVSGISISKAALQSGESTGTITSSRWELLTSGTDYTFTSGVKETASGGDKYATPATLSLINSATFTNEITTPKVSLKVIKKWLSNNKDDNGDYVENEDTSQSAYFLLYRYDLTDSSARYYYNGTTSNGYTEFSSSVLEMTQIHWLRSEIMPR